MSPDASFDSGAGGKAQPKTVRRSGAKQQSNQGPVVYLNNHPTYPSEPFNTTFQMTSYFYNATYYITYNTSQVNGPTTVTLADTITVPNSRFVQMVGTSRWATTSVIMRDGKVSIDGQSIPMMDITIYTGFVESFRRELSWYGYGPSIYIYQAFEVPNGVTGTMYMGGGPIVPQTHVDESGKVFQPPGKAGAYAAGSYS